MAQRIYSQAELLAVLIRARTVPIVSTLAGSALVLLPAVTTAPLMPPFGLLMLLGWRLLRPELWPAWVGLPLGLADDLLSGQPIGTAMSLWTLILLALDLLDAQVLWRDYWIDWSVAATAILLCITGAWWLAAPDDVRPALVVAFPQMILSITAFPIVVRLCARLDRWRLPS